MQKCFGRNMRVIHMSAIHIYSYKRCTFDHTTAHSDGGVEHFINSCGNNFPSSSDSRRKTNAIWSICRSIVVVWHIPVGLHAIIHYFARFSALAQTFIRIRVLYSALCSILLHFTRSCNANHSIRWKIAYAAGLITLASWFHEIAPHGQIHARPGTWQTIKNVAHLSVRLNNRAKICLFIHRIHFFV